MCQSFGEAQVSSSCVFHIQEVADASAVTANAELLIMQGGLNHAGDSAAEIQITAAEKIGAAHHAHNEAISASVHRRDQIRATLGNIVRERAPQRVRLAVR